MKRYFPFLRGKQHELIALRDLAEGIAEGESLVPIIEPVNGNATTKISLNSYIAAEMPFIFICNPLKGDFVGRSAQLFAALVSDRLTEYENWIPAWQVSRETRASEVSAFFDRYEDREVAVIYDGLPEDRRTRSRLAGDQIRHHVLLRGRIPAGYVTDVPPAKRVIITDPFNQQERNADYPGREFFTDMNTAAGNPDRLDFGDYSIVGDHYMKKGGPAFAVALHHIHFQNGPGPLDISHFVSDRTESAADTPGKIIEALDKLVDALDDLRPNDTGACDEYREIAESEEAPGLGYMKRLAIKHHLEVMLEDGIQL